MNSYISFLFLKTGDLGKFMSEILVSNISEGESKNGTDRWYDRHDPSEIILRGRELFHEYKQHSSVGEFVEQTVAPVNECRVL